MKYLVSFLCFLSISSLCVGAPAEITSPLTTQEIARRGEIFNFNQVPNASRYIVYVGSVEGARDIDSISFDTATPFKLVDVPANLERVHIRLWSLIDNSWSSNSYVFAVRKRMYYPQTNGAINAHAAQLWGYSSTQPITYAESDSGVQCDDDSAASVSSCTITMGLDRRTDESYRNIIGDFTDGATGALMNVKLKAWALAENGYCQIAVKAAQDAAQLPDADFLAHVEVFGDQNWKLAGRKITYVAIPFNLNKEGKFTLKINKEIIGECEVSIAVNVLGVYK